MEYKFSAQQFLPIPVEQAWAFFSTPKNLSRITPPEMKFEILTRLGDAPIYEGMHIEYTVRPFGHIPVRWETEIGKTIPLAEFTDRQVRGPYRKWVHRHEFVPWGTGTLMTDEVTYELPMGLLGDWVHKLFVRKRIETIFHFRKETLNKLFTHT